MGYTSPTVVIQSVVVVVLQSKGHFCTFFKLLLDSSSLQLSNAATLRPHWLATCVWALWWFVLYWVTRSFAQVKNASTTSSYCAIGFTDLLPVCLGSPISALLGDTVLCTGVSNLHKAQNILIKLFHGWISLLSTHFTHPQPSTHWICWLLCDFETWHTPLPLAGKV